MKKILSHIILAAISQSCSNAPTIPVGIEPTAGQWIGNVKGDAEEKTG